MGRKLAGLTGVSGLATALLAYPPSGAPVLARPPYTVVENRSVVLAPGLEVELGTAVGDLAPAFSLEAYDFASRRGIVQWRGPTGNPVLLLASDGVIGAISVAFEPAFRTKSGVGLGASARDLRRAYGENLRPAGALGAEYFPVGGFALGDATSAVTYFDTSCTGRVNAIGLALGAGGLRALGELWQPADPEDPCAPVD